MNVIHCNPSAAQAQYGAPCVPGYNHGAPPTSGGLPFTGADLGLVTGAALLVLTLGVAIRLGGPVRRLGERFGYWLVRR